MDWRRIGRMDCWKKGEELECCRPPEAEAGSNEAALQRSSQEKNGLMHRDNEFLPVRLYLRTK